MASTKKAQKTDNIIYIINYLIWWLTGIVIYVTIAQHDKRLKKHASQAVVLGIVGTIFFYLPIIGGLAAFLVWIYGMYIGLEAYYGRDVRIPVLSDYIR